jgi:hypothetical protein
VQLQIKADSEWDRFTQGKPTKKPLDVGIQFSSHNGGEVQLQRISHTPNPDRFVWGGFSGWFCASYGPFRRFSGGDNESERIYFTNPRLAPHLSVFGESVALTEALRWLQELRFKTLENKSEGDLLDLVRAFVNQPDFLPHGARLEDVSSDGVNFVDGNNNRVRVEELSERLPLHLEHDFRADRQLARVYGPENAQDIHLGRLENHRARRGFSSTRSTFTCTHRGSGASACGSASTSRGSSSSSRRTALWCARRRPRARSSACRAPARRSPAAWSSEPSWSACSKATCSKPTTPRRLACI